MSSTKVNFSIIFNKKKKRRPSYEFVILNPTYNSQFRDALGVTSFTHFDEIKRISVNDKSNPRGSRALLRPRGSTDMN